MPRQNKNDHPKNFFVVLCALRVYVSRLARNSFGVARAIVTMCAL